MSWVPLVPVIQDVVRGLFGGGRKKDNRSQQELNRLQNELNKTNELLAKQIERSQQASNELKTEYEQKVNEVQKQMDKLNDEYSSKLTEEITKRQEDNQRHELEMKKHEENYKKEILLMNKEQLKHRLIQLNNTQHVMLKSFQDAKNQANSLHKKFQKLKQQFDEETNHIVKFKYEREDERVLNLLLLGITGHGKSTFANRLYGDESQYAEHGAFTVSDGVKSETKLPKKVLSRINNSRPISIIDSPGTFDSDNEDRYHMNNLIAYLKGINGINAFIIVKSMGEPRLDGAYQNMIQDLEAFFGKKFWEHVILVITKVEKRDAQVDRFNNWSIQFRQELRKKYNLNNNNNIKLPIIGMSNFDNYKQPISNLIQNYIPSKRYECNALRSPIDAVEKHMKIARQHYEYAKLKENDIKKEIENVHNQMKNTIEALQKMNENVEQTFYPVKIEENNDRSDYNSDDLHSNQHKDNYNNYDNNRNNYDNYDNYDNHDNYDNYDNYDNNDDYDNHNNNGDINDYKQKNDYNTSENVQSNINYQRAKKIDDGHMLWEQSYTDNNTNTTNNNNNNSYDDDDINTSNKEWSCISCTLLNNSSDEFCNACNCPKASE